MLLGATIRAMREDKNMTQQGLAEYLDMSTTMISLWETKGSQPKSKKTIKALCELFNVNEQDLFGFGDGYYAKTRGVVEHITPQSSDTYLPVAVSLLLVSRISQSSRRAKRYGVLLSFAARAIFLCEFTAIQWTRCFLMAHMYL